MATCFAFSTTFRGKPGEHKAEVECSFREGDAARLLSGSLGSFPNPRSPRSTILLMSIKEIEAAALKLVPKDRARLAGKLLESLENLSEEENELIWTQEAERRDAAWNAAADGGRTAKRVLRSARAKLG